MGSVNNEEIPVIAFVGRSGCGKTTLLEKVVPHLREGGIHAAVVKHTQHKDINSDAAGTDTRRMWDAGAQKVVLITPDRLVQWQRREIEPDLGEVLRTVDGVDLIILEGFKFSAVPKIEVLRQAHHAKPLPNLDSRLAFVTDVENLATDLPCFELDNYAGIANFLSLFISGHAV